MENPDLAQMSCVCASVLLAFLVLALAARPRK